MTNEEKLTVFKAYLDGKPIECRDKTSHDCNWRSVIVSCWSFDSFDYRVKPEETSADHPSVDWKARYEVLQAANKTLQSAYDEMKEHRDALQANLASALARIEALRADFALALEQRDKAEQEADSLRGALHTLHDTLHNAILS